MLSENPDDLCDRIKLILQERQAGNNSNVIIEEMVAIIDDLCEYKYNTTSQHKNLFKKLIYYTQNKNCI